MSRQAAADELAEIDTELESLNAEIRRLHAQRSKLVERKAQLENILAESSAAQSDPDEWEGQTFDWSEKMNDILHDTFKLKAFRPLQRAAINAVLSGNDTVLLMSTGGGKSLCYQLPALIAEGLTLVVSPLLSLIEDQLIQLRALGIEAATLNQATPKEEVRRIEDAITRRVSPFRILYVTPEKLSKSKRIMNKLEKSNEVGFLKLIAIDEVHCCSQWGHDFRPDYKFLHILKRQFKGVPILGLTATATASVLDDVKTMLGIQGALTFRAGFNRPNLKYEVLPKESDDTLVDLIQKRFPGQSGIVYCLSRKDTEEIAKLLRQKGIKAHFYHAYLEEDSRHKVHRSWIEGRTKVIVATIAFGMGIDKPDVRYVIHHCVPKSIENYYQESGRAGRDGQPATCILLWKSSDLFRQSTVVCSEKCGLPNLYNVARYALNSSDCRRVMLSAHFDEAWEADWCMKQCDICCDAFSATEVCASQIAHSAVQLIEKEKSSDKKGSSGRLTALKLVELLAKNGESKATCEQIVAQLVVDKYLEEDFHFTPYSVISYITVGPAYKRLASNDAPLTYKIAALKKTRSRKRPLVCDDDDDDGDLAAAGSSCAAHA